jgi:glycolate oxidase iron-sulfur subunit
VCPRKIDITKEMRGARESFSGLAGPHAYEKYLARKLLEHPGSLTGLRLLGKSCGKILGASLPRDSGLRLRLGMFGETGLGVAAESRPSEVSDAPPLVWFPGCSTRYLFPGIGNSCQSLLAGFSLDYPQGLACCGLASWSAGDSQAARRSARKNIVVLEGTEGPILVSCASCYAHLKNYGELFAGDVHWEQRALDITERLVEMTAFLDGHGTERPSTALGNTAKIRVFYHDPCHLRFGNASVDRAREQILAQGNMEMVELPLGPRCCGQGGLFHVAHPKTSAVIRDQLVADVLELDPDVVTTTCSGCLMQWQQGLAAAGSKVPVLHLAQLLNSSGTEEGAKTRI